VPWVITDFRHQVKLASAVTACQLDHHFNSVFTRRALFDRIAFNAVNHRARCFFEVAKDLLGVALPDESAVFGNDAAARIVFEFLKYTVPFWYMRTFTISTIVHAPAA